MKYGYRCSEHEDTSPLWVRDPDNQRVLLIVAQKVRAGIREALMPSDLAYVPWGDVTRWLEKHAYCRIWVITDSIGYWEVPTKGWEPPYESGHWSPTDVDEYWYSCFTHDKRSPVFTTSQKELTEIARAHRSGRGILVKGGNPPWVQDAVEWLDAHRACSQIAVVSKKGGDQVSFNKQHLDNVLTSRVELAVRAGIGYEVPLSITGHPELHTAYRTADDSDQLVASITPRVLALINTVIRDTLVSFADQCQHEANEFAPGTDLTDTIIGYARSTAERFA